MAPSAASAAEPLGKPPPCSNACLDLESLEVTDELRRLMKEFEVELSVLKGRVDGLRGQSGELEASQFYHHPPCSKVKATFGLVR